MRELLLGQRPPRFVLLGRRGPGKSPRINAIHGEPVARGGSVEAETLEPAGHEFTGSNATLSLRTGFPERDAPARGNPQHRLAQPGQPHSFPARDLRIAAERP